MTEAPTPAREASRWDRTDLVRATVLLTAFAVTLGGLHTILQGVGWWVLCLTLVVVALGVGVLVRAMLPGRRLVAALIAPPAAALALAATIVIRFAADTAILGIVPTAASIERFRLLVRDAGYSITWQNVPASADEPISFVLALGVGALVLVAEIVVFSLRLPALAGLPLAAVFLVPGLTPEGQTDGWFFAASALAYLALLVVGRTRQAVPALAIGAAAVVSGLLLPAALPSTDI